MNVWLAIASQRHVHSAIAAKWHSGVRDQQVAFCRVTQMGLLRLLTNARFMGVDVISQRQAWQVYEQITADARVRFLGEPAGLEEAWKKCSQSGQANSNLWTDSYLLAFAEIRGLTIVTLDRAFHHRDPDLVSLLPSSP